MTLHKEFLKKYDLVCQPVVSEKTTSMAEQNKYMFIVRPEADKAEIKRSIEELFSVKVQSVNTLIRKGKRCFFKGRPGRRSDTKRAIVTLCSGCSIDFSDIKV